MAQAPPDPITVLHDPSGPVTALAGIKIESKNLDMLISGSENGVISMWDLKVICKAITTYKLVVNRLCAIFFNDLVLPSSENLGGPQGHSNMAWCRRRNYPTCDISLQEGFIGCVELGCRANLSNANHP